MIDDAFSRTLQGNQGLPLRAHAFEINDDSSRSNGVQGLKPNDTHFAMEKSSIAELPLNLT